METLKEEWTDYFHRVTLRLKENPRTAGMRNLVYLNLKDVIPYLPIYLARNAKERSLEIRDEAGGRGARMTYHFSVDLENDAFT